MYKAGTIFKEMKDAGLGIMTWSDEEVNKLLEIKKSGQGSDADREQAKKEMGAWVADYLDDAGYDMWKQKPYLFKAMIINSFPPLDPLDEKIRGADGETPDDFRSGMLGFMKVLGMHIANSEVTSQISLDDPLESIQKIA